MAHNVRFSREEIEGSATDFVVWLEERELKPEALRPKRPRRQHQRERATQAAMAKWPPNGVPPHDMSGEQAYQEVRAQLESQGAKNIPAKDTVLRALRALGWRQNKRS